MQSAIEALGEVELLVVGEILVAEHQHLVLVERLPDHAEVLARHRFAQIDAGDLGDEQWMQAFDGDAALWRVHEASEK